MSKIIKIEYAENALYSDAKVKDFYSTHKTKNLKFIDLTDQVLEAEITKINEMYYLVEINLRYSKTHHFDFFDFFVNIERYVFRIQKEHETFYGAMVRESAAYNIVDEKLTLIVGSIALQDE